MAKFLTITANIIHFCDDAGLYIGGRGLLQDQIAILVDKDIPGSDPRFTQASKVAQAILQSLAKRALARKEDCDALVGELNQVTASPSSFFGAVLTYRPRFEVPRGYE